MKSSIRNFIAGLGVFSGAFLCMAPVWSDDTEIFFGDVQNPASLPNVLFIFDTSGSMSGWRPQQVKDAIYQLLVELDNVNVGLMRFNDPGGPILFPVTYINEDFSEISEVSDESRIADGSDDAMQLDSTGAVSVDESSLPIVDVAAGGGVIAEPPLRINDDDDDATERASNFADGWVYTDWLDIWLGAQFNPGYTPTLAVSGLRFRGLDVPQGATITDAYIRMTAYSYGYSEERADLDVLIQTEIGDADRFDDNDNYNITSRNLSNSIVTWNIRSSYGTGELVATPNLASVIQERVDDGDWNPAGGEDDIVFVFSPTSGANLSAFRNFDSHDWNPGSAPELVVEYTTGPPAPADKAKIGLKFADVRVPRGATVTSARIVFSADRDLDTSHNLTIHGEDDSSPDSYAATYNNIGGRTLTSSSVAWSGSTDVSLGEDFQTPDLSDIVQEIADRSDWCGGNDMAFVVSGANGELSAFSVDGDSANAPRLLVTYDYNSIPDGSSCYVETFSRRVAQSRDDAEERSNGRVRTGNNTLDLDSPDPYVGMRFPDVTIPRGAQIIAARLALTSREDDSGDADIRIYAEDPDDADRYSSDWNELTSRSYASTTVDWPVRDRWDEDEVIFSPDISSLVSAVVSRSGLQSGNGLAIGLQHRSGSNRRITSFDSSPGDAPRLIVEFEADGSGIVRRSTRDILREIVSDLDASGWMPIQDTVYEAALYYTGKEVKWGLTRGEAGSRGRVSDARSMVPGTFNVYRPYGCSADDLGSWSCRNEEILPVGGTQPLYQSPINNLCQTQSHIILLTDGEANSNSSTGLIRDFIGGDCDNTGVSNGERCVKDLVRYLNENDQAPQLEGNQRVTTHTIGFNFSSQWLEDVATSGGGIFTTADNATELVEEIRNIIGDILKTNTTFVAPVAAVNEFNQLSHLNQVYFALFRPTEQPRWPGNLKKYTLGPGSEILDANGNVAIDPDTGFFFEDARSYWSPDVDGDVIDEGGAASQRPSWSTRNLFTYHENSATTTLSASDNRVARNNSALTKAMFGASSMSDSDFLDHIDWVRGRDVDDEDEDSSTNEDRYYFGDLLHSRPVAITYGGTEENPDVEVFFGSNAGVIQAVNAQTGKETFAFMPEELLPMQNDLRSTRATTPHPYGMDGTITRWTNDEDRDGISPADSGDFVRLYSGMRRGGRSYYALDATDRANPRLMWQIQAGVTSGFDELGQTWSRPVRTQILLQGDSEPRDVLLFSGGYDEGQDDARVRTPDSVGRAMYIVDALTGSLIWSGGKPGSSTMYQTFSGMEYSFPSNVSAIDVNQDGLVDMFFAADTGGQLWRFDIKNGESLDNLVTGGVIADLGVAGGNNLEVNNRRFYSSPSVALVRGPQVPELALAIGSGFRASPLSTIAQNRMYMIRQKTVFGAPSSYRTITEADLYNATSNVLTTADSSSQEYQTARTELNESDGWLFDLAFAGEKALSSPLILRDRIVFSTYTPVGAEAWCLPAAGQSRAYSVALEDAVRQPPQPLLTPSIVDQATVIVAPPQAPPDPNDPPDPNNPPDPNDPGNACPQGSQVAIKLNTEDGPIDNWCNNSSNTYWLRER